MARMRSQSGALPIRFGARIALVRGVIIASMRVDVDVVGVGLDVDERGHEPGPHHAARCRSRTSTAEVMTSSPGEQPEQLDREVERGRAGVAHDAAALAEQLGHAAARTSRTFLPMRNAVGAAAQHLDDRVDLLLVVDAARVLDRGASLLSRRA